MSRPARIAHLGLGAFARSHQAWYTQAVSDDWGIVAFPSRVSVSLVDQGYRYGLIVRGPSSDTASVIDSVVATSTDVLSNPAIAMVTITVTEAGYLPGARSLRRLIDGLADRQTGGGGPIALVPCDNVPSNGTVLRDALLALAAPSLGGWIRENVSFVSTMVDRITPAATVSDLAIAEDLLGWRDAVPIVTEPFTEWVLQGNFPAGRPAWENAGARFVDDVEPYERRKLWMLNAAHSLLAYRGLERGFTTVFQAWESLRAEVEQLWSEAREVLGLDPQELDTWLAALRIRWENPRMEHLLSQIASGGEQKIPARIGAVIAARAEAGLPPGTAELETIAAWERYRKASS